MDSLQFGALLYLLQFGKDQFSWTFFPFLQFALIPFNCWSQSNLLVLFFPLAKFHFSSPAWRENRERLRLINNNNNDFANLRLGQNSKRVYFLSCKSYHLVNQEVFNFTISGSSFQSDISLDSKTHFDFLSIPKRYLRDLPLETFPLPDPFSPRDQINISNYFCPATFAYSDLSRDSILILSLKGFSVFSLDWYTAWPENWLFHP